MNQSIYDGKVKKLVVTVVALAIAGCSTSTKTEKAEEKPAKAVQAPEKFYVKFETTKGDFIMEVVRDRAPAERIDFTS